MKKTGNLNFVRDFCLIKALAGYFPLSLFQAPQVVLRSNSFQLLSPQISRIFLFSSISICRSPFCSYEYLPNTGNNRENAPIMFCFPPMHLDVNFQKGFSLPSKLSQVTV